MFQSARLKLTFWYLLIIMSVSILFSIVIYRGIMTEVERSLRIQQFHLFRETHPYVFAPESNRIFIDPQLLNEAKNRILLTLLFINLGILMISGGAGYFLAGITLRPIQEMVDEQNRFITDASHELRTPLTSLKSEIEVFLREEHHNVKEADKLLESNLEEVNNLQILSDNLIQLAQSQKPNGRIGFTSVSLLEILHIAEKKLRNVAKRKSIAIKITNHDYPLIGDKESLIQLFCIFLDNAIKYSPEKSVITITSKKTDHSIIITITDEGIGIDKKDIPHIFDRFYRADTSRTKQTVSGYGLGLSIAKKITDSHQGSITVKSELEKGTIFTIELPLHE